MKSGVRKGRRPAALALWALGVLGALAALVFLAGPYQSAEAHPPPTGPGVEIIKTAGSAFAGHHLWPVGNAVPSHFLNLDTNNDNVDDAISVAAGIPVRLAVHVRDTSGDPNSTAAAPVNVALTATGSAFFTKWSRVCTTGDLDGDGVPTTCEGTLFDGLDVQSVTAQAVSDTAGGTADKADIIDGQVDVDENGVIGATDKLADVQLLLTTGAIDQVDIINGQVDVNEDAATNAADDLAGVVLTTPAGPRVVDIIDGKIDVNRDGVTDGLDDLADVQLVLTLPAGTVITGIGLGDNPDGIAIFEVVSLTATDATITASVSGIGSDSVRIIWVGTASATTITPKEARLAQDINPATGAMTFVGDPDSLVAVRVADSANNPVPNVNVICTIATASRGLANIKVAAGAPPDFDDDGDATDVFANGVDPDGTGNIGDVAGPAATIASGLAFFTLESQDNGGRGDVTLTCWADLDNGGDLDVGEPSATATVKVVGPTAAVTLTGNTTMNVGDTQPLTAAVRDSDGNPVADDIPCAWASFGGGGGVVTPGVVLTSGGNSTNTAVAASPGSFTVLVSCDDGNPNTANPSATLNITVQAAGAPSVPPAPPTQVALWPATSTQAQITFQAPAGATSYRLCTASDFNFVGESCSSVTAVSGNIILVPLPTGDMQTTYIRIAACNSAGCSPLVFAGALAARQFPAGTTEHWNFVMGAFEFAGTVFAWGQNQVSVPGKNSDFNFYDGVQGFGGVLQGSCPTVAPGSSCVRTWAAGSPFVSVSQAFPPFGEVGVAVRTH